MPTIEDFQAQANSVRAEVRRRIEALDARLPEKDHRAEVEAIRAEGRRRLDQLRRDMETSVAAEHQAIRLRYVGPPRLPASATAADRTATESTWRDAVDRARAAAADGGHAGLADLMNRAERFGDTTLERAGLAVAIDRRDASIVQDYAATHPEAADDLARLLDVENASDRIARELAFSLGR